MLVQAVSTRDYQSKSLSKTHARNLNVNQSQRLDKDSVSFKQQPNGWAQLWEISQHDPLIGLVVGVVFVAALAAPFGIASFLSKHLK